MPLISVIVPVYNVENYLHRCVNSILSQSLRDFELILVDDGSPDGCPAICDKYAAQDPRVHVIHQANGGLSSARNAGIDWAFSNSTSEWLTFVDSDDWIHPEMLERLLSAAKEYDVSVSLCGHVRTDGKEPGLSDNSSKAVCWPPEEFFVYDSVTSIVAWGKLYRKSCFNQIRYPLGKIHEDEYVTYRILFDLSKIAVIDAPMYAYFQNPVGIMKSKWSLKRLDIIQALDEQVVYFKANSFEKAYKRKLRQYIYILSDITKQLEPHIEFHEYFMDVRRKLRQGISWCRKEKLMQIIYDVDIYISAYPFLTFFWKALFFLKYAPQKILPKLFDNQSYQWLKNILRK